MLSKSSCWKTVVQLFGTQALKRISTIHVCMWYIDLKGFPGDVRGKEPTFQCKRYKRHRFDSWVGKIPWRRTWQPTPAFLSGKSHGQRSLVGYSPWVAKSEHNWVIKHARALTTPKGISRELKRRLVCHGRNEKVSCCLMSLHCQRRGLNLHDSSPLSGYTEAGTWLLVDLSPLRPLSRTSVLLPVGPGASLC